VCTDHLPIGAGTADEFLARLPALLWFAHVGQPIPDSNVPRIRHWDEWAGPEEKSGRIIALSLRHQAWHDALLAAHPEQRADLEALWSRVTDVVMGAAAERIPYDPDADAWHAPTTALWQAVWTAGLVAWHLASDEPIPADLAEQWAWYARGHWPCGYAYLKAGGEPGPLQIY
jgi:hypothetical protein